MLRTILTPLALAASTLAGSVLWDGRFNDMSSSETLNDWSFSDEVGPYQYYIHGTGNVTEYVNLSPSFKNPADTVSVQGAKITIDNTSYWNNDGMRRTELIPQTTAPIDSGKVYYHFSMSISTTNPPGEQEEHQICFFESAFTEMKYGLISGEQGTTSDGHLHWYADGTSQWNVSMEAGIWHNIAYEIDFTASTVGFWHSTGSDDLTQVIAPVTASTSSNGEDWHLGVLRLAPSASGVSADTDDGPEDWYFSGVYIESGDLTTSVTGPGNSTSGSSTTAVTSTTAVPSTTPPASTTTAITTSSSSSSTTTQVLPTTSAATSSITSPSSTASSSALLTSSTIPTTLQTSTTTSTSTPITTTTAAAATTSTSSTTSSSSSQATLIMELIEAFLELLSTYAAGTQSK